MEKYLFSYEWIGNINIDATSKIASIFSTLISFLVVAYAIKQYRATKNEMRRATAYQIYSEYLKLSLAYPVLASGNINRIQCLSSEEKNKYPWFVANMLFSLEQIYKIIKDEEDWMIVIRRQLLNHATHLKRSRSVREGDWSKSFTKLINQAIQQESHDGDL